jgi:hypothetical protein
MKTIEVQNLETKAPNEYQLKRSEDSFKGRNFLFPTSPNRFETRGFVNYVAHAYRQHYGIIINPTDIWYMITAEIAAAVKKTPNDYSSLFTKTPGEKQLITVVTGDPETIDPHAVVEQLKTRVPTDVDTFLPDFSTDTIVSKMSMSIAFCDMVSPYYNYGTLMCGIPTVEIGGTREDWNLLLANLDKIRTLFTGKMNDYLLRCDTTVRFMLDATIKKTGPAFLSQIIKLERCGSGSDEEISGWILDFVNMPKDKYTPMLKNVHQHVSKMEYKNLETQRTFELYTGIFYSEPKGNVLVPCYNAHRIETTGKQNKSKEKKAKDTFFEGPESITSVPILLPVRGIATSGKTCTSCGADMTPFSSRKWKHALCPSCAFITVSNLEDSK